jgi:hypothetical protein
MEAFNTLQGLLMLIIGVLALGMDAYALVDAIRQRTDAFPAAGKLTKPLWMAILAVATAIGFDLIAFVAAAVYLVDVRPAIKAISGGGSGSGPYGGW